MNALHTLIVSSLVLLLAGQTLARADDSDLTIRQAVFYATSAMAPTPSPFLILPLGASITYGTGANSTTIPGGYRTELNNVLSNTAGVAPPTFLGSQTSMAFAGDASEGHPGYRIDQVTANLTMDGRSTGNNGGSWLTGTSTRAPIFPNFVLIHIGTNDVVQHYDTSTPTSEAQFLSDLEGRLSDLLTLVAQTRPDARILLASIIPLANSKQNDEIQQIDRYIGATLVPQLALAGDKITFVDQYAGFIDSTGHINNDLLSTDGVHPTQAGYNVMGDIWANAILGVPEPSVSLFVVLGTAGLAAARRRRRKV